jgi:hypothetical protein
MLATEATMSQSHYKIDPAAVRDSLIAVAAVAYVLGFFVAIEIALAKLIY